LLWLVSHFLKSGVAGLGGRWGGAILCSRKSDPFGYWLITVIHALAFLFCAYLAHAFYYKYVITPHGFIDGIKILVGLNRFGLA